MEGSAWDDEFFFMEKTPQGYWADFFDPAWESIMRSAKIFNDEDMPEYWQNRFRAMGFYMPLVVWFSRFASLRPAVMLGTHALLRRLMRKMWRLEKQLAMRTDGRRNEGFARRFRYGLGIKRRCVLVCMGRTWADTTELIHITHDCTRTIAHALI